MKQAIAYYRVSTSRQGKSGLGLDAQQSAVTSYCKANGFELVQEVIEVRSTRKYRIGLYHALSLCREAKATLMVARLDRLGRDVEQIAGIVKSSVEIIVTDNPHANRLTIHILAAVAEEQRQRISENTKAALSAARSRGTVLGKNGQALAIENRRASEEFAKGLLPLIRRLKMRGIVSVRAVARELNRKAVPTFRGNGRWHPSTVCALLQKLKCPFTQIEYEQTYN